MNIKKATKVSAITVAAVAAVGIGAVSFAQWKGGTTEAKAEVGFGTVSLVGFVTDKSEITLSTTDKLVPYNQEGTFSGVKVVSFALPKYEASANYKITVAQTGDVKYDLYANIGTQITAAPAAVDAEGWEQVDATFTYSADAHTTVEGQYLNIILDSVNNADMGKSANLTVTLALQ